MRTLAERIDELDTFKNDLIQYVEKSADPVVLMNFRLGGSRTYVRRASMKSLSVAPSTEGIAEEKSWAELDPAMLYRLGRQAYGMNPTADRESRLRLFARMYGVETVGMGPAMGSGRGPSFQNRGGRMPPGLNRGGARGAGGLKEKPKKE